jgi:Uncharacterized conserved protein
MTSALNDQSLDQIFRSARTPNGWADRPVEDDTLREIYDLMKWGPTSANSYDDGDGVTAAFNLNLLERMNRELGANFQPDAFRHEARWNPDECAVEMHIVSLCPQIVTIAGFDFDFWTGDSIHTESSRKYDAQSFTRLAELGGWDVAELWTDADRLFAVFGLVAAEPAQGS